jgi:two-component system sensor histidine kinase QseC
MPGVFNDGHGPSLRRRLLRMVTLATVLGWGLAAAFIYGQASHDVQELMDGQMAELARLLLAQAPTDPAQLASLSESMARLREAEFSDSDLKLEFEIGRADGTVLLRSAHAPDAPLNRSLGYADYEHAGKPWRILVLEPTSGDRRILVAHPADYRNREALEIASNAVLPLALLLPIMVGLIYFSIRRGLKPLHDLAADVASRTAEDLEPLQPATAPREIRPLVKAINQFLGRLNATLENERRFTADAAHELRTPLAALKVQAQIAMAARNPAQSQHALAQVVAGSDRATHLVDQLLRLARLDPIVSLPNMQPFDLGKLATSLVADHQELAAQQSQKLSLSVPEGAVMVRGDAELMGVALRNLVDNALRYTPAGSDVRVSVGCEHGEARVTVTDNGSGVPEQELGRLMERFFRGSEAAAEGTGLGLAIVHRIAELHGARLEVKNLAEGGFAASLRWPLGT